MDGKRLLDRAIRDKDHRTTTVITRHKVNTCIWISLISCLFKDCLCIKDSAQKVLYPGT